MTTMKKSPANDGDRYHHGDLRNALIVAAAQLIDESGSDDFAMIEAARRAGVSSAAPYRHFRDKDELLLAVSELGFFDLASEMLDIQSQYESGSVEGIIELGKGYIKFVTERPAFFDLMWGERGFKVLQELEEQQSELRTNGLWLLANQVQAWSEREGLSDIDPVDLAMKLWSMAIGLSHLVINHHLERFKPNVDPYQLLATSTHSFLQGVKETQRRR